MLTVSCMKIIRRNWGIVLMASVGVGALGLASCAQKTNRPQPPKLANVGKPALHAIMDDELKHAMAELHQVSNVDMRAELYSGDEIAPNMDRVAAIATDLAKAAQKIPGLMGRIEIAPDEKHVFLSLAEKLRKEALDLHEEAFQKDVAGARATMERVNTTCNACHAIFREMR